MISGVLFNLDLNEKKIYTKKLRIKKYILIFILVYNKKSKLNSVCIKFFE